MGERALLLIGDYHKHFIDEIKMFEHLEKEVKCVIKKNSEFYYTLIKDNINLDIRFCFGPRNDRLRRKREKIRGIIPPTIEDLDKVIRNSERVYYLGFCGVLKGKINSWYLPVKFGRANFSKFQIGKNGLKISPKDKEIIMENIFAKYIHGKKCKTITINQVLAPKYSKDNSEETILEIAKEFKRYCEVMEMENYEIVKRMNKNSEFGSILFGIDSPIDKKKMIKSGMKGIDWEEFRRGATKAIKTLIKNLEKKEST